MTKHCLFAFSECFRATWATSVRRPNCDTTPSIQIDVPDHLVDFAAEPTRRDRLAGFGERVHERVHVQVVQPSK